MQDQALATYWTVSLRNKEACLLCQICNWVDEIIIKDNEIECPVKLLQMICFVGTVRIIKNNQNEDHDILDSRLQSRYACKTQGTKKNCEELK